MNRHFLNATDNYHRYELNSLSWEVTLSVMLEDPQSPCRSILKKSDSFGNLLFDYLCTVLPMDSIHRLVEIGGGYGHLMRDFLKRNSMLSATMIDLSPFLLSRQQETLRELNVQFIHGNFLEMTDSVLSDTDLAILNEVIGDFPTACEIPRNALFNCYEPMDTLLNEVRRIYNSYRIALPVADNFTLNLGAIQALEKLCAAQVPYIYISEHSCEARVPKELTGLMELACAGDPECIQLKGHNEYTIRFTDLERVAAFFGYNSRRGQYIDFVEPVIDQEVAFIMHLGHSKIDRYEIIQQFIEDLAKYEYLILSLPLRNCDHE